MLNKEIIGKVLKIMELGLEVNSRKKKYSIYSFFRTL